MPFVSPVYVAPVVPPRIGGAPDVTSVTSAFPGVEGAPSADGSGLEVASRRTPMSAAGIRQALAGAYRRLHGRNIGAKELDVLSAHVAHETARGERMFNYNFGGMKGVGPSGLTTRYTTTEVFDGEEKKLVDGFRAYRNPIEGATDYLRLLEQRFPSAARAAASGDVTEFSGALKRAGYYTADEEAYTRALRAHAHEAHGGGRSAARAPSDVARSAPVAPRALSAESFGYLYGDELAVEGLRLDGTVGRELPTSLEVSRVLGAVRALDARVMTPVEEPTADGLRNGG
ncbi:MAG: hypothetical protein FJ095_13935 [Deltaproteobacteria bacterium]|nr:hypothetical protein [Deltaproteobacteria bacterium]